MNPYHHRTVLVGDIKTHFLEAGEGPALMLLHGGEYGAAAEITWRHNIEYLAKHFYVIAPDMLGWGGTDKIYSFSDQQVIGSDISRNFWSCSALRKRSLSATRRAAAPSCARP